MSGQVGTNYRKDVLANFWIHCAGTLCAAIFLCYRSFVAKEDAPGNWSILYRGFRLMLCIDSMNTQTNHKTTFGKVSNHPLQILTRSVVVQAAGTAADASQTGPRLSPTAFQVITEARCTWQWMMRRTTTFWRSKICRSGLEDWEKSLSLRTFGMFYKAVH